ncbi:MAG: hypothetical protein IT429_17100 [Gemmataceae bacterium]|nr:hypothetical protein [Gemmataceae bacterium]
MAGTGTRPLGVRFRHGNGSTISTGRVEMRSPRMPSKMEAYSFSIGCRLWAARSM